MAITVAMQQTVAAMYAALFNRAPEKAGLDFWCGQLDSGVSLAAMAQTMYETAPARATYPDGISNADVVKAFYLNVLGRAGDAEGLAFWEARLNTLGTKGALIAEMVANVQSYTGTDPAGVTSKALFDNKVTVGFAYAVTLGKEDVELAKSVLALVTATDTSAALNAANVGQTFTLTTGTDSLIGTSGNDTFNGVGSATAALNTYADADQVIDTSSTDNDTYNLTVNAAAAPKTINVENVKVTAASTGAAAVNAAGMSGVKNLTVTRADLTVGGATIIGEKTAQVDNLDASKVAKVTAGAATKDLIINQTTKAGVVVAGDTATGVVTVKGAATIDAAAAVGKVQVTAFANADAGNDATKATTENAKAVTINAAKSVDVEVLDNGANKFTGAITINAAVATEVAVNNAVGGVTINAEKGASRIDATGTAAAGIVVAGIDDSGATIVTGSYAKTTNGVDSRGQISLDGTTATSDKASVSAAGIVAVNVAATNQVDDVTLSGNNAAVTYQLTAAAGAATTKYTLTGSQDVTVEASTAALTLTTVTDTTTDKTTTVKLTTVDNADLSKVAVDLIDVAAAADNKTLKLATGANVRVSADQTTAFTVEGKTTDATVNLSTGDDTAASGATIDISVAELKATTNVKTLNIDATTGKLTATKLTAAATTDVVITGNKAVNLDSAGAGSAFSTAKSINAANLTAALTVATDSIATIAAGSGADKITVNNGAVAFTVEGNAGNDTIVVTAAAAGSLFVGGAGDDKVTLSSVNAVVVDLGAGNDTVTIGDANAVLVGGDGTDKLVIGAGAGAVDLTTTTANDNFAFTGFETVDIGATDNTVTVKAATVTGQAFTVVGTGGNDTFAVVGKATADTIDLSGVLRDDTNAVTLTISGAAGNDTITGTAGADTIVGGAGSDVINGGEGVDTVSFAGAAEDAAELGTQAGVVVNLSAAAVTSATIAAAGFGVTANSVTSVAANSAAYLYAAADANNSASVDVLSSIENITGSDGNDYLVGSANANVINGGTGNDYIIGGKGGDTINVGTGTDTVAFAAGDSFVGAVTSGTTVLTGVDVISGLTAGDILAVAGASITGATAVGTAVIAAAGTTDAIAIVLGNYNATTGIFTADAAGADSLVQWDSNGAAAAGTIESIVLVGVTGSVTAGANILTLA